MYETRMASELAGSNTLASDYLDRRWKEQSDYFESKAKTNQSRFMLLRRAMLISSWLTPIAIFILILVPATYRDLLSLIPLLLSTIAVGTYQWEELHNYGAQWAKFRLVAERLKGQKELFLQSAGPYSTLTAEEARLRLVQFCEGLIEGTDINYFVLMVDPLRRNQDIT
jgi:hypothetical protein